MRRSAPASKYFTKSRFKLACECPTKLFYADKPDYANQSIRNTFLDSLAKGGFQVGALAKHYFPEGVEVATLDISHAIEETAALLKQEQVTIFEAAIATDKLLVRADVLVKNGNTLSLYEVKAKSFDFDTDIFDKKGAIKSKWLPYVNEVAFQKHVIVKALPEYKVYPYLMLVDKGATCPTDGLNQKFLLTPDNAVIISEPVTAEDLAVPLLKRLDVDKACREVYETTSNVEGRLLSFSEKVELLADRYRADSKIISSISKTCDSCEFYSSGGDGIDGKRACWEQQLGWQESDFEEPSILEVWKLRGKNKLIAAGKIKMADLEEEDIDPKADNNPGISLSERQWLQVKKVKEGDNSYWLDKDGLRDEMQQWQFPLHFIDFETLAAAIPFHAGRRPYETIAYQFSHHLLKVDDSIVHAGEYLNSTPGAFPNYEFVRALKRELEHDNGTIFCYAVHENSVLGAIDRQLREDPREIPDREALSQFIRSISHSSSSDTDKWVGERDMVDMCELVKRFYFDPATKGSNSIKQILPSILNQSKQLQTKYAHPIYGAAGGIPSRNFSDKRWIEQENGQVKDPYSLLPKLFEDLPPETQRLLDDNELKDGGAAMTAYARMQFQQMQADEREEISQALLKYCELDTLAMVMLYEGWRDLLAR